MEATGIQLANVTNAEVVLVDYSQISSCNYDRCVNEIMSAIGGYLSKTIVDLYSHLENIELIGHSLGAHIAGIAGAFLDGKLMKITGLKK